MGLLLGLLLSKVLDALFVCFLDITVLLLGKLFIYRLKYMHYIDDKINSKGLYIFRLFNMMMIRYE